MKKSSYTNVKCLLLNPTYLDPLIKYCPSLMGGSAGDNEIHSGVFNLHAMKASSLSEDYVFAEGEEGDHFRGHCLLVWKITVRNFTTRGKINTQASIHYIFFGGFPPPPISVFQWTGGIIFHSMSERLIFSPPHIMTLEHIGFLERICIPSFFPCPSVCLSGSLSSIILNN